MTFYLVLMLLISTGILPRLHKASVIFISVKYQNVTENRQASAYCNTSGIANVTITWVKESNPNNVVSRNANLTFTSISRADGGRYICNATNVTSFFNDTTFFNVMYPPKINSSAIPKQINSWLYDIVHMTCQASGNPPPAITWLQLNSARIGSSGISLNITNARQFGEYVCRARNFLGNDSYLVTLNRTRFPPDPPDITNNVTTVTSQNFTLKWNKPNEHNSAITRYVVWKKQIYNNESMGEWETFIVIISRNLTFLLDWEMSYQFAVSAENRQGRSDKGKYKNFTVIADLKAVTSFEPKASWRIILACAGGGLALIIVIVIVVCYKRRERQPPLPCPKPNIEERTTSGRCITSQGQRDMDRIAGQVLEASSM